MIFPKRSIVRDRLDVIRMGDLMALSLVVAQIDAETGVRHQIGIANYSLVAEFIPMLGGMFFRGNDGSPECPLTGDVWTMARGICGPDMAWPTLPADPMQDFVVVAPVWQATYNKDRNWSPGFARDLVEEFSARGRRVIIIGAAGIVEWGGFDASMCVVGSIARSCALIRSCETYIGGDTGLTHYAAAIDGEQKIVGVYGEKSGERFNFSPIVRTRHPYLYVEQPRGSAAEIAECVEMTPTKNPPERVFSASVFEDSRSLA